MSNATAQPAPLIFSGLTQQAAAITAGSSNSAGQPTRRFVKDLIRVGNYSGGGGHVQKFNITLDDHDPANGKFSLNHWRDQFLAMQLAGIDVPTPNRHTADSEANRGFVRDMFIEGEKLYAVIEAIGQDAITLMARAKVSINVPVALQAGNGTTYDYPIDHVAIVTNPVITDQRGFVAIESSQPGLATQALVLALEPKMDIPGTSPAAAPAAPASPAAQPPATPAAQAVTIDFSKLSGPLGIELTEENKGDIEGAILARFAAIKAERDELKAKADQATATPATTEDAVVASLDPNIAGVLIENATLKLARLVESGNITPAVRDELAAAFVGTSAQPNALALAAGKGGQPSVLGRMVDILAKNDPVKLGTSTGGQAAIAAARQTPGGDTPDPDLTKRMAEHVSAETAGPAL